MYTYSRDMTIKLAQRKIIFNSYINFELSTIFFFWNNI